MWKTIVNKSFDPESFLEYCKTLKWTTWKPKFIVLHNTGAPNLKQRPLGLTEQHIQNLVTWYRDTNKWTAGPHLFIDDHQIWAFTPLTTTGVHSPSWNNESCGVEMLGDYQTELFNSGRGLNVHENTVAALAILFHVLNIQPNETTLKFHKEDSKTTHKTCPGKNVNKTELIKEILEYTLKYLKTIGK